eukprot:2240496-Amphidinium_carterae.1
MLSRMASSPKDRFGRVRMLAGWDVSRAHLYGTLSRRVYAELPEGDKAEGMVALLHKSLYGLQEASQVWQSEWGATLESDGWQMGIANPSLMRQDDEDA